MVEEAITASVRRNPQPLADALFPVIGPAIRKAIQHALATMMESFNRSVEHSLSWRALQWRLDRLAHRQALRRDRAAQHTRIPRRAGLPDPRDSGLLLQHVAIDLANTAGCGPDLRDADRDPRFRARFVQGRRRATTLDALRIGDLRCSSSRARMRCSRQSCAARRRPTSARCSRMRSRSSISSSARRCKRSSGDAALFDRGAAHPEACLVTQFARRRERAPSSAAGSPRWRSS